MSESGVVNCKHCEGTGQKQNNKRVGAQLKKARIDAGIGMRSMADSMRLSHSYVCLLEMGRRNWRPSLIKRYIEVVAVWEAMNTNKSNGITKQKIH